MKTRPKNCGFKSRDFNKKIIKINNSDAIITPKKPKLIYHSANIPTLATIPGRPSTFSPIYAAILSSNL